MLRFTSCFPFITSITSSAASKEDDDDTSACLPQRKGIRRRKKNQRRDPWESVLLKASSSVVMLKINTVRFFESAETGISISSGFVVDKKLGLILTNRHVVQAGPIVGKATFFNNEEAPVKPIYRDPEHDFGFLQFDPQLIQHMTIAELRLYPEGAKLGTEIRVVGSDAGERLMVLGGTIAQNTRECPEYAGFYQDVNTFYLASSSSTSGGSSGAPVLDSKARVVGLNAGAAVLAASSFFLPVDRIVRALQLIRMGQSIPRGSLQTVFSFTPLDGCRRLGMSLDEEREFRKAQSHTMVSTGALVVARAVIDGPGHRAGLLPGDIVLSLNTTLMSSFLQLETILDASVDKELVMDVRRGDRLMTMKVIPQNMHETIPSEFLEYSSGIIHTLGFQIAYQMDVPSTMVFIAQAGYSLNRAGVGSMCIITEINKQKIRSLDDVEHAIASAKDHEKVSVRYFHLARKNVEQVAIVTVDKKWFPFMRAKRDDATGIWEYRPCSKTAAVAVKSTILQPNTTKQQGGTDDRAPLLIPPGEVVLERVEVEEAPALPAAGLTVLAQQERQVSFKHLQDKEEILRCLVYVTFDTPFRIDGIQETQFTGCGIIVDAELGLVWCDRRTVVSCLGDIKVVVASTLELDCKVVYLHPMQNFALIQYNPSMLGRTEIKAVEPFEPDAEKSFPDLQPGDVLSYAGLTRQRHVQHLSNLVVASVERANVSTPRTPCFTCKNFDRIEFDNPLTQTLGGVFIDDQHRARGFASYFLVESGQPDVMFNTLSGPVKHALNRIRDAIKRQLPPRPFYSLGIEIGIIPLGEARDALGLPDEWFERIARAADVDVTGAGRGTRDALKIANVMAGTAPASLLKNGDLLLAVDEIPAVSYREFDLASCKAGDEGRTVKLTIFRDHSTVTVEVPPIALSVIGTQRVLRFCGMQLQETHPHVLFHGFVPSFLKDGAPGVFVSCIDLGSPAEAHGIFAQRWIVELNSQKVLTLDEFQRVISTVKQGEFVRVLTVGLTGEETVHMMMVDLHYFPSTDLLYDIERGIWELKSHHRLTVAET